jgi:hypothetical protein
VIDPDVPTSDDVRRNSFFPEAALGIRETINRHSALSTTVVVLLMIGGVVAIGMELRRDDGKPPAKNFFTDDDGQTWFSDSASLLPPFDHNGRKAVRCYVFSGKNGNFVGLMEKYSDDTLKQLAKRDPNIPLRDSPPAMVKKPGEKQWQNISDDQEAAILMHITGPDGSDVERVMP